MTWFFDALGIDEGYFKLESVETVADHIGASSSRWNGVKREATDAFFPSLALVIDLYTESLYGAKVQAHAGHQDYLEIKLEKETEVRVPPFQPLSALEPRLSNTES